MDRERESKRFVKQTNGSLYSYSSFTRLWLSESMKLPRERVLALRPNLLPLRGERVLSLETAPPTQKRTMQMKKAAKAAQVQAKP